MLAEVYINHASFLAERHLLLAKPCAAIAQLLTRRGMQVNQFAQNINIVNVDITVVNTALTNLVQLSSGGGSININQVRQACTSLRFVHRKANAGLHNNTYWLL